MTRKRARRDQAANAEVDSEEEEEEDEEEEEESGEAEQQETTSLELKLELKILEILHKRAASSTMCPSEAARAISATNWRPLMEKTRQVARRMALQGHIHITQKGVVCDPLTDLRGPIRLKLAST